MTPEDIKVIDLIISSDIGGILDQIMLLYVFELDADPATNQTMDELQELLVARKATRERFRVLFEIDADGEPHPRLF